RLCGKHPINLAEDRGRSGGEVERMRQERRVDAVADDRKLRGSREDVSTPRQPWSRDEARPARAAAGEELPRAAPGADLQQLPPENVLERRRQKLGLGRKECPAEG